MSHKKPRQNNKISEEEQQFFRDEMSGVRPLVTEKRIEPVKQKPAPKPKPKRRQNDFDDNNLQENSFLSDPVDLRDLEINDVLFFARTGIQQKLQKKLRRGELPVEEILDLHGYTVAEAKIAILDFLYECRRQNIRYLQIIHGKGYRSEQKIPVLKTHVAYWLPQLNHVLAYSSALPKDGGTGALYVLLKSNLTQD